jgi:hypothetical protein
MEEFKTIIDYYHQKIHHNTEQTPNKRYEESIKK